MIRSLVALLLLALPVRAQVVSSAPCPAQTGSYEDYVLRMRTDARSLVSASEAAFAKIKNPLPAAIEDHRKHVAELNAWKPMPKAAFDAIFKSDLHCERSVYRSLDGIKVVAYSMRAANTQGRAPLLLFLRGGNRELGKIDERVLARFFGPFARQGYMVIGTQYRGVDGGEGKDEFGGRDVDDVLAVAKIASARPDVDGNNVFVYGVSRGGMMAYLALRRGLHANAAVIHAGASDLEGALTTRPGFEAMYEEMIPDYRKNRAEALRARSAVHWAEEIRVPMLLLHGTADWRVPAQFALKVAERLQMAGREYGLVIYSGDDHPLSKNFDDVIRQSMKWFTAHSSRALPVPSPAPAR